MECDFCGRSPEDRANKIIEECDGRDSGSFGRLVKFSRNFMEKTGFCSVNCRNKSAKESGRYDPDSPANFISGSEV